MDETESTLEFLDGTTTTVRELLRGTPGHPPSYVDCVGDTGEEFRAEIQPHYRTVDGKVARVRGTERVTSLVDWRDARLASEDKATRDLALVHWRRTAELLVGKPLPARYRKDSASSPSEVEALKARIAELESKGHKQEKRA